jgi:hypothetical protein
MRILRFSIKPSSPAFTSTCGDESTLPGSLPHFTRLRRHQPNNHQVVTFSPLLGSLQSGRLPLLFLITGHKDGVPLARVLRRLLLQDFKAPQSRAVHWVTP